MSRFILDIHSAQKFIRVLADQSGLRVVYETDVFAPRTDGKTLYVPSPLDSWSDNEYTKWLFLIYHELGHNVPEMRDCFDLPRKKKISMDSFLGVLMNIIEDYRQEHYKYDEFEGKKKIMSKGRSLFLAEQIEQMIPSASDKHNMLRSAHIFTSINAAEWMPDLVGIPEKMYNLGGKEQKEWVDTLMSGDYSVSLNNLRTAEDTYELSKRIIKEVFKLDPEEEEEKARKNYAEEAGGKDSGEEGEGEQEALEGGKEGKSSKKKGKNPKVASHIKYDDVLIHKHDESGTSYISSTIDYEGSKLAYSDYVPYNINDFKIEDLTSITTSVTSVYDDIEISSTGFSNKIKRLLTILSKATYEYGKKTGKLHNKNLYKVTVPSSREFQERIFRQKKLSQILDTCVYVLIDMSGSMGGDKMRHAAQAAILLNDSVAKLGVPIEIAGFTEQSSGPIHYVFKKFNTKCENQHLKERIKKATLKMLQNADGESILYSYSKIRNRKEKKKVLIVLSDGQPCADRGHGIAGFTERVIKAIEAQKIVSIYGIGIMDSSVKRFYTHHKVIRDSDELEDKLLEFVKDKLLKSA